MSQHEIRLCKLAPVFGGHYIWEWPERCELLQDRRVRALASTTSHFAIISASAVDWIAIVKNNEVSIQNCCKSGRLMIDLQKPSIRTILIRTVIEIRSLSVPAVLRSSQHITRRIWLISYVDRSLAVVSLAIALLLQTVALLLQPAEDLKVLVIGTSVTAIASMTRDQLCLSGAH